MNHIIRKVAREKDIFETCDFFAIKNNDDTYLILYNRGGTETGLVFYTEFMQGLIKNKEPIVLSTNLFKEYWGNNRVREMK